MSDFILKIFFSGLMTLVPSQDGKEVTVLLLNAGHNYTTSDGATLPHHTPVLVARAGSCAGTCPTSDSAMANYFYPDLAQAARADALADAVTGGAIWPLSGGDLSLRKGCSRDPELPALFLQQGVRNPALSIPTTSLEREDFDWIASLKQVCPTCDLNGAVLGATPPSNLVAARFKLRSGKVFTYQVVRTGTNVSPLQFSRLDGQGSPSSYSQAVTSWVGAEIQISGESVELVEDKYDGSTGRSMSLTPNAAGQVELAVLNLPQFAPPPVTSTAVPDPGAHFEAFYDITTNAPAQAARLVPKVSSATVSPTVNWDTIHPRTPLYSELLSKIRLDIGRSPYDRVACPVTQYP